MNCSTLGWPNSVLLAIICLLVYITCLVFLINFGTCKFLPHITPSVLYLQIFWVSALCSILDIQILYWFFRMRENLKREPRRWLSLSEKKIVIKIMSHWADRRGGLSGIWEVQGEILISRRSIHQALRWFPKLIALRSLREKALWVSNFPRSMGL